MGAPYVSSRSGRFQWMMQRVSAVLLLLLTFSHFFLQHFTRDAVSNGLTVTARLNDPWWQAYYALFVVLAIYHGVNGLIGIAWDYAPKALHRGIIASLLWTLGAFFGALGLVNIVNAKPLAEAKRWYAEHGFAADESGGHVSFPVGYDLRVAESEVKKLRFFLEAHVNRAPGAVPVADIFAGADDPARLVRFTAWARQQISGFAPPPVPPGHGRIFASDREFALWALNLRKANARGLGDQALLQELDLVPAYHPDVF